MNLLNVSTLLRKAVLKSLITANKSIAISIHKNAVFNFYKKLGVNWQKHISKFLQTVLVFCAYELCNNKAYLSICNEIILSVVYNRQRKNVIFYHVLWQRKLPKLYISTQFIIWIDGALKFLTYNTLFEINFVLF